MIIKSPEKIELAAKHIAEINNIETYEGEFFLQAILRQPNARELDIQMYAHIAEHSEIYGESFSRKFGHSLNRRA